MSGAVFRPNQFTVTPFNRSQIMLLVRQLTFGTTATFLGIFKAVPEGTYTNDYIMLDGNNNIKTFTEKCS